VLNAAFALQAAGWLVTASTTLFGAPFWFDLLQRAVQLRSTGTRPDDNVQVQVATSTAPTAIEVRTTPALPNQV
jgi:hypothetical protein